MKKIVECPTERTAKYKLYKGEWSKIKIYRH